MTTILLSKPVAKTQDTEEISIFVQECDWIEASLPFNPESHNNKQKHLSRTLTFSLHLVELQHFEVFGS